VSVAIDPVCGMEVTIAPDALTTSIEVAGLAVAGQADRHRGSLDVSAPGQERFYFCGRGCLLDFQDDPAPFLDAGYQPSGM
jgi:YHS domain-containing protein